MDKKKYNKPEMKIVFLRHQTHLLTGSDPDPDNGGDNARRFDWDD